ncbi:Viral A-type inclusion protein [Caenorhabditis elegans]|uniref:Viral A-type inclusion protein n=1 Tax=Caenorhabditis elegans TaxID=6239 RepID=A0A5E4LWM9_CAEEL|nr:Viral A-type inclusion protein [Caenorhabditis elegans]VVC12411.1 Viral A-type inclusion protein [Caenorhabditis elegans]
MSFYVLLLIISKQNKLISVLYLIFVIKKFSANMHELLKMAAVPFEARIQTPMFYLTSIKWFMQTYVPNYSQEQSELLEQIIKNVDEAVKAQLQAAVQAEHVSSCSISDSQSTISDDDSEDYFSVTDEYVSLLQEIDKEIEILEKNSAFEESLLQEKDERIGLLETQLHAAEAINVAKANHELYKCQEKDRRIDNLETNLLASRAENMGITFREFNSNRERDRKIEYLETQLYSAQAKVMATSNHEYCNNQEKDRKIRNLEAQLNDAVARNKATSNREFYNSWEKDKKIENLKSQLHNAQARNAAISDREFYNSQEKDRKIEKLKQHIEKLKLEHKSYVESLNDLKYMFSEAQYELLDSLDVKPRALCDYYRARFDLIHFYSSKEKERQRKELEQEMRISEGLRKKLDASFEKIDVLKAEIENLKQRPNVYF